MQGIHTFTAILIFILSSQAFSWVGMMGRIGREETLRYESFNPTVELKETRSHNQASSEECYMFAFVGALEVANQNGWGRFSAPEISSEYLVMKKFEAWASETWINQTGLDQGFYFDSGGDVHHAMKLSVDAGLMPQQLFNPRLPFEYWDFESIYKDVRTIVREEKVKVARAKSETEFHDLYKKAMNRLQERLHNESGKWPKSFSFNGYKWDSQSFSAGYGIKENTSIHMMYPKGRWDMGDPMDLKRAINDLLNAFRGAFSYRQTSWTKMLNYFVESVDQKLPVIVSMRWGSSYHVMNVVGYEYDSQNRLVSFKLKNSWGDEYGKNGYAFFEPYDLQKYVTSAWGFRPVAQ